MTTFIIVLVFVLVALIALRIILMRRQLALIDKRLSQLYGLPDEDGLLPEDFMQHDMDYGDQ